MHNVKTLLVVTIVHVTVVSVGMDLTAPVSMHACMYTSTCRVLLCCSM